MTTNYFKLKIVIVCFLSFTMQSCITKPKEEISLEKENDSISNNSDSLQIQTSSIPNWAYDQYDYLKHELDSLGLRYKTMRNEDFYKSFFTKDWVDFEEVESSRFYINSNDTIQTGNLKFEILFDDKLSYMDKLGYYGGIREMKIFKNGKHIQTMHNIEDPTAIGIVDFSVGDYNLDGHPDIKMRLNDNYFKFLLFNPISKKFEHIESWDYLRTRHFNTVKKQLLTNPEGTAVYGEFYLYQVKDTTLNKLKTFYYHKINDSIGSFITEVAIHQ
mgnify:CR=1 FL=1